MYFFDFHEATGVTVDDVGEELPSVGAARTEARRAVGEVGRDLMAKGLDGYIAVVVRSEHGPIFQVSATFATTECGE